MGQFRALGATLGISLSAFFMLMGPTMAEAQGPSDYLAPPVRPQNFSYHEKSHNFQTSNFTKKFGDKVRISKDTFVSVEEALQLLKSTNKIPHIKLEPKSEKDTFGINEMKLKNKNLADPLSRKKLHKHRKLHAGKSLKLTKKGADLSHGLLKSFGSEKIIVAKSDPRTARPSDARAQKNKDFLGEGTASENIPHFTGGDVDGDEHITTGNNGEGLSDDGEVFGDGGDILIDDDEDYYYADSKEAQDGLEIQTESLPATESAYRDCVVFVGNELVEVHRHGASWSDGDDRCAVCQCDDGEQRCYYHYCNGPELGFITPPSAETPTLEAGSTRTENLDETRAPSSSKNADLSTSGDSGTLAELENNSSLYNSYQRPAGGSPIAGSNYEKPSTELASAVSKPEPGTSALFSPTEKPFPSTTKLVVPTATRNEAIERMFQSKNDEYNNADDEHETHASGMSPWPYNDDEDEYYDESYDNNFDKLGDNIGKLFPSVDTTQENVAVDPEVPQSNNEHSGPHGTASPDHSGKPVRSHDCESDCGKSCPYGYKITPGAGCPTCKCLKCRPLNHCTLYCPDGYTTDEHGCPTCICTSSNHNHSQNQGDMVAVHHTLGDITATHKLDASFPGQNNDVTDHRENYVTHLQDDNRNIKFQHPLTRDRSADVRIGSPDSVEPSKKTADVVPSGQDVSGSNSINVGLLSRETHKSKDPHNHFYDNAFNILREDEVSILRDRSPDESRDFRLDHLQLPDDVNVIPGRKQEDDAGDDSVHVKHHRDHSKDGARQSSQDFFSPLDYDLDFVTTEDDDLSTTVARAEAEKVVLSSSSSHSHGNCSHAAPKHCQDPSGTRYPVGAVWYRGACTVCRCYGAGYAECTITQCSTAYAPSQCRPPPAGHCCPVCPGALEDSDVAVRPAHVADEANVAVTSGQIDDDVDVEDDSDEHDTVKEAVRGDISSICLVVLCLVATISIGVVLGLRYWRRYHSAKYDIAATSMCEEAQKLRPVKLGSCEIITDPNDVCAPLRPAKCV